MTMLNACHYGESLVSDIFLRQLGLEAHVAYPERYRREPHEDRRGFYYLIS